MTWSVQSASGDLIWQCLCCGVNMLIVVVRPCVTNCLREGHVVVMVNRDRVLVILAEFLNGNAQVTISFCFIC